ncbi:hypothetical protein RRG08_044433 [Elysia crispata]|uniref:Fibrinogen C-terminal domain-containing protein n=1 Tax=Elysia crispata TaxID=231223 RepID=A0AAE0XTL4_9GAST|nr:hypothetical protein RRG08_044433 [Elysia crispata]
MFQRRVSNTIGFYTYWSRYAHGFGDVDKDHWLGLEAIHKLTFSGHADLSIRVGDNGRFYDLYVSGFKVKDAKHLSESLIRPGILSKTSGAFMFLEQNKDRLWVP